MLTISVWPRRLKEFLLTHPLYKSPAATDSLSVGRCTASSAPRSIFRPCAHAPFRDPLPMFRAYRRILLSQRYTTVAGKSDRRSANSATVDQW